MKLAANKEPPVTRVRKAARVSRRLPRARAVAKLAGFGPAAKYAAPAELAALCRERREMQDAIAEAAQVQRRLCAPRELRRGGFEIAGELFPVRHLSGDFFKFLDLGARVGIALGDVAGKGISAGLWVPHLLGLLRMCTRQQAEPAAALAAINRELCAASSEPTLAAVFLALLDPQTGELTYSNAGQPPALLLRRDQRAESLQLGGPLLGAVADARFECGRTRLAAGDALLLCSDGVVECRNARGEEFTLRRLAACADVAGTASAGAALFTALAAVLDFANGRPLADDLTLVVVRGAPAPRRGSLEGP